MVVDVGKLGHFMRKPVERVNVPAITISPHDLTTLRNFAALANTHNVPFKPERKVVAKLLVALDDFFAPAKEGEAQQVGRGVEILLEYLRRIEIQEGP